MDPKISVRRFDFIQDMPDVRSWWEASGWPEVPSDHLSTDGYMGEINGNKAIAAWVYHTNSSFCLLEFIVMNPSVRRAEREAVFNQFVDYMIEYTKDLGFKTMFLTTKSQGLISRLQKKGFQATETGMTSLVGRLK